MAYVYANAQLLSNMPTQTLVDQKHPAGICASYTCDYIKKRLDPTKAAINLSTYEQAKRINKMVSRQKSYESLRFWGGKGDLKSLFDAYGIQQHSHTNYTNGLQEGWTDIAGINGKPVGIYYIALEFQHGGHAIAYDKRNQSVADANAGIYQYPAALSWETVRTTIINAFPQAGTLTRIQVINCELKT